MIISLGAARRVREITAMLAGLVLALALGFALATHGGASAPSAGASLRPAEGSTARLDPRIAHLASDQSVQAIVQFAPSISQAAARQDVAHAGGHVFTALHIIPALGARLTAAQARTLAAEPGVRAVSLNGRVGRSSLASLTNSLLGRILGSTYNQTLGVPRMWASHFDGSGVGVAVIDTGINGAVADFRTTSGASRVIATAITNPAAENASDSYGHGTDVAGIIAGNEFASGHGGRWSDERWVGRYVGVAPGANLISIKASDESGTATVLNAIYGLQFAVDHRAQYNIRVVNMSLDAATAQSYRTDPLDAAAESAWMHGIVVVTAAGNRGSAPDAVDYAPANDPYVITVGATDENGSASPAGDTLARWSSRGVTQDGFAKPDVTAPGAHIVSVLAPESAFAGLCPSCILGGRYIRTSGTSMAAPMISGIVADLLQARPDLTPDEVKALLTSPAAFANPAIREVDAASLLAAPTPAPANQGLTPSALLADASGGIDYTKSSWSQSSWSAATGAQAAGFAQSSWSCTCGGPSSTDATPSQSSWSHQSSWSLSSWSLSSWSTLEPLEPDPGAVRGTGTPAAQVIERVANSAEGH